MFCKNSDDPGESDEDPIFSKHIGVKEKVGIRLDWEIWLGLTAEVVQSLVESFSCSGTRSLVHFRTKMLQH